MKIRFGLKKGLQQPVSDSVGPGREIKAEKLSNMQRLC